MTVFAVTLPWIAPPYDVGRQVACDLIRNDGRTNDKLADRSGAIVALDLGPAARPHALIVVDRDEEPPAGSDALQGCLDGLPHGARVMQNAPRVDNIELPERLHEIRIQNGALQNGPVC